MLHAMVYHNYARMKHIGPFVGNWDDPVVVIHDPDRRRGIAMGNEAPGVLKRTAYHTRGNNLEAGLTHTVRVLLSENGLNREKSGRVLLPSSAFIRVPTTDLM